MIRAPSLRAMELFAALMRTRSLTAAARRIGISQPAASLALKELEAQTGLQLFTRGQRHILPTAAAEALLPAVERLLAEADAVRLQVAALQAGEAEVATLRVASILSMSGTLLPAVISGFQRSSPRVAIRIEVQPYAGVLDLLRQRAVELGFVNQPDTGALAGAEPLLTTWLACLMAPDHPLAGRRAIGLEALRQHTTIFAAHGDLPIGALRRRIGTDAASGIEVNNVYAAIALARQGVGVALLNPLLLLSAEAQGLLAVPLQAEIPLTLAAVAPTQGARSRAVSGLVAEAHRAARAAAARLEAAGMRARTP
ncbi:LysR family transcriptional regulator [Roseomonas sp. AR75]|uniref:LysR family transcriptional regulator n=1 Tax=Roseomonas sp. AR75 TaxID=2562311 RepID=UPI0010C13EF6|nr:LysR family transcriptional regulator [Roseomonas sp. AR75]